MREAIIEEPPSWRGHSFTLLVFGGIVVLCTIFFVLGMLVGRTQGQRIAEMAAAAEGDSTVISDEVPAGQELTFYKPVDTDVDAPAPPAPAEIPAELPPEPTAVAAPAPLAPPIPSVAPPAPKKGTIFLQIAALSQEKEAEKQLNNLRAKGFRGLILSPTVGGDRLFRVQVGPYQSEQEAIKAKKELESKGFKQIFMKK